MDESTKSKPKQTGKKYYRIIVTYGTWPEKQTYARVPSFESAVILRNVAISLGYRDARIVEEIVREEVQAESQKHIHKIPQALERGPTGSRKATRSVPKVHDLRTQPDLAPSG